MHFHRSTERRVRRRAAAAVLAVAVSVTGVGSAAAGTAAKPTPHRPPVPVERLVPHRARQPHPDPAPKPFAKYDPRVASHLPGAGSGTVDLSGAPAPAPAAGSGGMTAARLAALAATLRPKGAAAAGSTAGTVHPAGTLPIALSRPAGAGADTAGAAASTASSVSAVTVDLTDQATAEAAGIHGLLFSLAATAGSGPATVSVDDSGFVAAFGGDYAGRLHLVQLPACALTTPTVPACQRQTPLAPVGGDALSAVVALDPAARVAPAPTAAGAKQTTGTAAPMTGTSGGTVVGVTSAPDGAEGSYTATSLSPTGTWTSGTATGAFDYSYPVQVPKAIGGPTPDVSLSYDSSSQDGRTASTNNQSEPIGDGWMTTSSYIERTYRACTDDSGSGAPQYAGDLCWAGQVLTMSLNGKSTQIVYDTSGSTPVFRAQSDTGDEKIEQLKTCTNGTYNGECWRVTENGVQYYFGLNQLPGYTGAAGQSTTQSAWTVPVYGAHSGDPCNASTFAASSCLQGWRWNLDYVVDLHSDATAYYYQPELGYYGADMKNTGVKYTRGGYLTRVDYGMTASTVYSGTAPEQIVFGTAERCIPGWPVAANTCADSQFTVDNAAYWPDVPIDLNCAAGSTNCTTHGPSFWSRKRITSITTQVQAGGQTQQVDQYKFVQSFPDGGDHAPSLWLDSIEHVGLDTAGGGTGTPSTPLTSFDPPVQLPNRVGTVPNKPLLFHDRIGTVKTEMGALITVTYNPATCTTSNVPGDPSTNTADCFPVYWTFPGAQTPQLDWFQKYTVHSVLTQDTHDSNQDGTFPELLTTYKYDGGAAWHYDDNEITKAANRTYGQFRGYATVETRSGDTNAWHLDNNVKTQDRLALTKTTYFRGMDSDTPTGTGGTAVTLTSLDGAYSAKDVNALAGQVFEVDSYNGDSSTLDSAKVTLPTVIGPTASRPRTGLAPLTAQMVRTASTYSRQSVSYGWRKTETDSFFNTTLGQLTTGREVQSDDRGEVGATGNIPRCRFTRYTGNPSETLVLTAETIDTTQDCSTAGASPSGTLVADSRTSYDGHAFTWDGASGGTAPTKGDPTGHAKADSASGATATSFVTQDAVGYDGYGRVTSTTRTPNSTAPDGSSLAQTTTTTYTPASGGVATGSQTRAQITAGATPVYQTSSQLLDPGRQEPVEKVDAAGMVTDLTYDPLGRLTAVWLPNESKAAGQSPNSTFGYTVSASAPSVAVTRKLADDNTYTVSETFYDALGRVMETQTAGENGTTIVNDTQYDSHGWTVLTNNSYAVSGAPLSVLQSVAQNTVPDTSVTEFDGLGRPSQVSEEHDGTTSAGMTVSTAYTGDTTVTIPRAGGTATRTVSDARGQQSELDQYTAAPALTGTPTGGFTAGTGVYSATTYQYTPSGKQSKVTGPDNTVWTLGYDLSDNLIQTTGPDSGTSKYGFDDAGNQVSTTDAAGVELDYTYDLRGRKLTGKDKSRNGFLFASWVYDTVQAGKLTSSTSYVSGVTGGYTVATTGYTSLGKPTGTKITLPASEAPLPTTYSTTYSYSTNQQALIGQIDPRVAGLLGENISYSRDTLGNATGVSGASTYVSGTKLSPYGEPLQVTYGPQTNEAQATYTYDDQSRRLTDVLVTRTQAPGPNVDDTSYGYDASGDVLSVTDKQTETGNTVTDTQCFTYDALSRLHEAWTAAGACPAPGTGPSAATVASGVAAYWQTFGYDAIGDRRTETDHAVNGATGDTTTTYTDACTGTVAQCPNGPQPHTLTGTSAAAPAGTVTTAFGYDPDGRMTSRAPAGGTAQQLAWNDQGRLDSVTVGTAVTRYVYDADGNELIRRDPTQTTFFAGDTQIVVNTAATPATVSGAVRSYMYGGSGAAVAIRSSLPGGGLDYSFADPHQTRSLLMDTTTQAVSRQLRTPYGQIRASVGAAWIDPVHGFLDKPVAPDGYTDVGARKYDPTLGMFLSVDPKFQPERPQALNGYTYGGDSPLVNSDPSGENWLSDAFTKNPIVNQVHYEWESLSRAVTHPVQTVEDMASGTWGLEQLSAYEAINFEGGQVYDGGPYCGSAMSCVTGVSSGKEAMTTGHTVRWKDASSVKDPQLQAHEQQHVKDIESVGGYAFYGTYFLDYYELVRTNNKDPYGNIYWERRAYAMNPGYDADGNPIGGYGTPDGPRPTPIDPKSFNSYLLDLAGNFPWRMNNNRNGTILNGGPVSSTSGPATTCCAATVHSDGNGGYTYRPPGMPFGRYMLTA